MAPITKLRFSVQDGASAGRNYDFVQSEIKVGRVEGNDFIIDSKRVSRFHAVIRNQGDRVELQDLGSTNGTFINDQRVSGKTTLHSNDIVDFGGEFRLVYNPIRYGGETEKTAHNLD